MIFFCLGSSSTRFESLSPWSVNGRLELHRLELELCNARRVVTAWLGASWWADERSPRRGPVGITRSS